MTRRFFVVAPGARVRPQKVESMNPHRIRFDVEGSTIAGHLYLPDHPAPHPAVVVGGPMTSVKEQVTGVYAAALARRGIAALSIDPRHFGESGGEPRQYENYHHKIADYRAAVERLAREPCIDAKRLGAVGVCLGTGYVVHASLECAKIRAIAGIAGYYRDVPAMRARDPDGFAATIAKGRDARRLYESTGELLTIPAAAMQGDAAMTLASTYDYYATSRAGIANYVNAFAVMSREHFVGFDVMAAASRVAVPMRMIHAQRALSPAWARQFYDHLRVKKSLHWLDAPNQTDFYDRPHLVEPAADLVADHLHRHLQ